VKDTSHTVYILQEYKGGLNLTWNFNHSLSINYLASFILDRILKAHKTKLQTIYFRLCKKYTNPYHYLQKKQLKFQVKLKPTYF
jgi:hypothetical protein